MELKIKKSVAALTAISIITLSGTVFATNPTSGQLVLINSAGNVVNGSAGATASSLLVQVSDATGVCSTTASLAYGGVVTVSWSAANTHSSTKCTDITSVAVSAIKTSAGVVQYDSTANTTPPATVTAATTFTAPTTPIANLALIVTGNTGTASTNSPTSWGISAGVAPIYSTSNGALTTTGILGAVGMEGIKASKFMMKNNVLPAGNDL